MERKEKNRMKWKKNAWMFEKEMNEMENKFVS